MLDILPFVELDAGYCPVCEEGGITRVFGDSGKISYQLVARFQVSHAQAYDLATHVHGDLSGSRPEKRSWLLRLRIVVFGTDIVALDKEIVALFLQRLRHGVDLNQWLVRTEGKKSSLLVADQSVLQVGRPTVHCTEDRVDVS